MVRENERQRQLYFSIHSYCFFNQNLTLSSLVFLAFHSILLLNVLSRLSVEFAKNNRIGKSRDCCQMIFRSPSILPLCYNRFTVCRRKINVSGKGGANGKPENWESEPDFGEKRYIVNVGRFQTIGLCNKAVEIDVEKNILKKLMNKKILFQ